MTKYYIQDSRQYVGNCLLWWCPNHGGYTTQIDEAGLYTEEEMNKICSNRDTDIAWPQDIVEKSIVKHVRIERLRSNSGEL